MRSLLDRAARWLLPLLILTEIVLVRGGWVDLTSAIWVVIGIESLLALVGLR